MLVKRIDPIPISLVQTCLNTFKKFLNQCLQASKYLPEDILSVEKYIKKIVPASLNEYVLTMLEYKCHPFYVDDVRVMCTPYIYNRIRLAELFGEEDVDIVYNYDNAKDLDSLDFRKYKKCVVHWGEVVKLEKKMTREYPFHYMTNNVCTMTSVVWLYLTSCNTEMYKVISKSCPCLEELTVLTCSCTSKDLVWLSGFNPSEVVKYIQVKGLSHQSKSVCKNLKRVKIPLRPQDLEVIAIMLTTFTKLEKLELLWDSYALTIALQLIYGYNSDRYAAITNFLSLKTFKCGMVLSPAELALVVKACPLLSDVDLNFSSSTRNDQNLFAELLPAKNLSILKLHNADVRAFMWFLSQRGKSITYLYYFYELTYGTTRSFVEFIAEMCPELEELYLDGDFRTARSEDIPEGDDHFSYYSSLPLKTLTIKSDFSAIARDPLISNLLWLLSPTQLDNVMLSARNPYWFSADDCNKLFTSSFFSRAKLFSYGDLIQGMNETMKLLEIAPFLENPQGVCLANGEYEYFERRMPIRIGNYIIRNQ